MEMMFLLNIPLALIIGGQNLNPGLGLHCGFLAQSFCVC
jgi:hypothetical protein